MMLGLTGAAYWVVADLVVARGNTWAYLLLAPLLALAYATAFAAERIAPFFDDWNDHDAHGDNAVELPAHPRLRVSGDRRRAADPGDLLAVPVPGPLADAVADVGAGADGVRHRRLRLHDDALPQPPLRAAVAAARGASRRRPALRHERRAAPSAASDHRHDHRQRAARHHGHAGAGRGACSASSSR